MTGPGPDEDVDVLVGLLRRQPTFDALSETARAEMARVADIRRFAAGELILDAFSAAVVEVFVVMAGSVDLWDDPGGFGEAADERLGVGGVFGFSSMLTERSVGPRVLAAEATTVAAIPTAAVEPAFASPQGARFLVTRGVQMRQRSGLPSYSLVADLVDAPPPVVAASETLAEVAARMTACAGY